MVHLTVLAILTLGNGPFSPEAAQVLKSFRQFVVISPLGGKRPSDRSILECKDRAQREGTYRLKPSYTLLVSPGGVGTLVSDEVQGFREKLDLPDLFKSLKGLPPDRVSSLAAYSPAMIEYMRAAVGRRLPFHEMPAGSAFGRTNCVLQPQNRVALQSGGSTIELTMSDFNFALMSKAEKKKFYEPVDATALPLAGTPEQIGKKIDAMGRTSDFIGQGLMFAPLRRPSQAKSTDEIVQEALDAYRTALRKAGDETKAAMKPIQDELARRYPDMVTPFPKGSGVSSLPANTQEALRAMLATQQSLNGTPKDIDAFLASATIKDASVGFMIGVAFQPDNSLLGINFPPR